MQNLRYDKRIDPWQPKLEMSTNVKLLPSGALPPAVVFPLCKLIPVLCLGVGTAAPRISISFLKMKLERCFVEE